MFFYGGNVTAQIDNDVSTRSLINMEANGLVHSN
jgi:hypothetical protein